MPIYEYECTTCGKRFEAKRKFSDPPILSCKAFACSKDEPLIKLISAPAIVFKGSGWYVTDYSDKFKKPQKDQPEEKAGEKAGEKPSEAKAGKEKAGEAKVSNGSAGEGSSASRESHGPTPQAASPAAGSASSSPSPPSSPPSPSERSA